MASIFWKELHAFLSSLLGYIAIIVFLVVCGFFLWIAPDNNMLDYGFANMDKFFILAPWVLLFLIPAITMRSFSDEFKSGTIEVISTLPITEMQLIGGKFFASFVLVICSIIPTLIYIVTISSLSIIENNLDTGGIIGSYIGLVFLAGAFTAVGLFCSSFTNNQVIAFLVAVFLNFILFSGFETISRISVFSNGIDFIISQLGMQFHYDSISRGVLDTRDLIYFSSIILLFLLATKIMLDKRKWN
jgi:ABC-2 type transport system permease protein